MAIRTKGLLCPLPLTITRSSMSNAISGLHQTVWTPTGTSPDRRDTFAPTHNTAAPKRSMAPSEFASTMLKKYDGGDQSTNYANDAKATLVQQQTTQLLMTGYPPGFVTARMHLEGLAPLTAQMDEETRERFAARAKTVLGQPDPQRDTDIRQLETDVQTELQRTRADPLRRLNAVFNMPAGAGLLGESGAQRLQQLRNQYGAFSAPGATPQQRETSFAQAVRIKTEMQRDIHNKASDIYAATRKSWSESAARVNGILDEAAKYTPDTLHLPHDSDDPDWDTNTRKPAYAKTFPYQSVMEKLLSDDGYSSQERSISSARMRPPEQIAQDLLTFQQGMTDPNSAIHRRVQALQDTALATMNQPGPDLDHVERPKTYEDVARTPPAADNDYVNNLAKSYGGALKDIDGKNRAMLREHTPGLADKILYGIGRVLSGLSPIPGADWLANKLLDAEFPDQGGLTREEVGMIDAGTALAGLLLGGIEPEGEHLPGAGEPHPSAAGVARDKPSLPASSVETFEHNFQGSGSQPNKPGPTGSGNQRTSDIPTLPTRYAAEPSGMLQPDPGHAGVLTDPTGQQYILDHGQSYPVRYDAANRTWRLVQPDKPTDPGVPVERRPDGNWQPHGDVGLQGGGNESRERTTAVGDEQKAHQLQQAQQTLADLQTQIHAVRQDLASTAQRIQEIEGLRAGYEQRRVDLAQRKSQAEQERQSLHAQLQQLRSTGQPLDPHFQAHVHDFNGRMDSVLADIARYNDELASITQEINSLGSRFQQLGAQRQQYEDVSRDLQTHISAVQLELNQLLN
ncbi:hypothetical protein GNZ11_33260 [Paraburkholderia xenovorans]|nr:hypothetical protein [Paraburkholderia xenovorans]